MGYTPDANQEPNDARETPRANEDPGRAVWGSIRLMIVRLAVKRTVVPCR